MTKEVQSVVLVLLGGAVLRISFGDTFLRYVKPQMQVPLLAAGTLLLLLGITSLWFDGWPRGGRRDVGAGAATAEAVAAHADDGHGHVHQPRVAWLLLLPVLTILLVAPPALGSYAAGRDSGRVAAPVNTDFPPLPDGDVVDLTLTDYATRAVWDEGDTLEGRSLGLTGFVTPRKGSGWYLTRMTLSCCAADAAAVKVEVRGAPAPAADTWVRLVGTWVQSTKEKGGSLAVIQAQAVEPVEPPSDPYE